MELAHTFLFLFVLIIITIGVYWVYTVNQSRAFKRELKQLRIELTVLEQNHVRLTENHRNSITQLQDRCDTLAGALGEIKKRQVLNKELARMTMGFDLGSGRDRTAIAHLETDEHGNLRLVNPINPRQPCNHDSFMECDNCRSPRRPGRKLDLE